jgi:hypothetical protein
VTRRIVLGCVGGPLNGRLVRMRDDTRYYSVPFYRPLKVTWGFEPPPISAEVAKATYRREVFGPRDDRVELLVHEDLSPMDALRKLLEDHRP